MDVSITAVMITGLHPSRYRFARLAIECFQKQTYENRELLIVNHGTQSLFCGDPRIRELRLVKRENETVGDLRNIALDYARGTLIMIWDDDDWHHPRRMEVQMSAHEGDAAVFLKNQIRLNLLNGCALYASRHTGMEATMLHPRAVSFRYPSLVRGSDTVFKFKFQHRIVLDNDPLLYVRIYHGTNLWSAQHIMYHLADSNLSSQLELAMEHHEPIRDIVRRYMLSDTSAGSPIST